MLEDIKQMKEYVMSLSGLKYERSVLDIGCGVGRDLIEIGKKVSGDAKLVGIDKEEELIRTACQAVEGDNRFSFLKVDLEYGLPFGDERFDFIFCSNVLECIDDKETMLRDVYSALKPRGKVSFSHFDWGAQLFNAKNKDLCKKVLDVYSAWRQPWMRECDPWMGRRLGGFFERLGLFRGSILTYLLTNTEYREGLKGYFMINREFSRMVESGLITEEEYRMFCDDIAHTVECKDYFYGIINFIYIGERM